MSLICRFQYSYTSKSNCKLSLICMQDRTEKYTFRWTHSGSSCEAWGSQIYCKEWRYQVFIGYVLSGALCTFCWLARWLAVLPDSEWDEFIDIKVFQRLPYMQNKSNQMQFLNTSHPKKKTKNKKTTQDTSSSISFQHCVRQTLRKTQHGFFFLNHCAGSILIINDNTYPWNFHAKSTFSVLCHSLSSVYTHFWT